MHGGPRPGAGRRKGSTNAKTAIERAATKEKLEALKAAGPLPLDILLGIMRSSTDQSVIIDCAKAAAPYVHPKLNSIEHKGDPDNPIETVTTIELTSPEVDDSTHRATAKAHPGIHGPS